MDEFMDLLEIAIRRVVQVGVVFVVLLLAFVAYCAPEYVAWPAVAAAAYAVWRWAFS